MDNQTNNTIPSNTTLKLPQQFVKSNFGSMSKKNIIIGSVVALVVAGVVGFFILKKKKLNATIAQ